MRFLIKPHQDKEWPYEEALLAAGHTAPYQEQLRGEREVEPKGVDVFLTDFEIAYPKLTDYAMLAGFAKYYDAPLVAYPHGGSHVHCRHLSKPAYETAVSFVHGPVTKQLWEAYDYPNPVEWVGYPGPRKPLVPRECKHVVFAPHHPLGSGWMPADARKANTEAFHTLLKGDFDLTVRLVGTKEMNGIPHEEGVRYVNGKMEGSLTPGDVAVAGGTYASNCLAQGIPVVMYNQEREWQIEFEGKEPEMVLNWEQNQEFVRYPFDLSEPNAIENAAADIQPAQEWIDKFIPPFDPEKFVSTIEEVVGVCAS